MSPSQDELQALDIPTLLVHGRDDKVIPVDSSRKLAELIPNATLDIVGECGHWVQIEKTELLRTGPRRAARRPLTLNRIRSPMLTADDSPLGIHRFQEGLN